MSLRFPVNIKCSLCSGSVMRVVSALQSQQQFPFPCSTTAVNMANFGCLPQEILEMIFQYLPLSDQINSAFSCAQWNEIVRRNLKHVKIDPSTPFGGRWVEENMRCICHSSRYEYFYSAEIPYEKVWHRDENDPVDREMKKLIPKLCKLTNKIETLNIKDYHLDINSLTELFSSQTGIKTLRMNIHSLPEWIRDAYYEKILELIIRHQASIEVIQLNIDTTGPPCSGCPNFVSYDEKCIANIKGIIKSQGRLSFPKLKSLRLFPWAEASLRGYSNDLFESLIATCELEELKLSKSSGILPWVENRKITDFLGEGTLDALKKFSLISHENVTELIKHCPSITHLKSEIHQWGAASLIKIISTYGSQLKSLACCVFSCTAIDAILEECKNLESLALNFQYAASCDDSRAIKSSIPLLGDLETLTEIKLCMYEFDADTETICELIERCGINLQSFTLLGFKGFDIYKILNVVGTNCKSLKKLKLDVKECKKEKETRRRQLKASVDFLLERCRMLRTLKLDVKVSWKNRDIFPDQIGHKQPHLTKLRLSYIRDYPTPDIIKLIQALPYCDIASASF